MRRQLSVPVDSAPTVNWHTKPRLSAASSYSAGPLTPGASAPPPYVGDGNGFYGVNEKSALKRTVYEQERNIAAWQVLFPAVIKLITVL